MAQPVDPIRGDDAPEDAIGLCLSGGGYRAMVFHVGVIWRLYDVGILKNVARISSVSGGSITAGVLALNWRHLSFDPSKLATDFIPHFVKPIRSLAAKTIDIKAAVLGIVLPGRVSDRIASAYESNLFSKATLQDLPDWPRFVFNATNVQSGAIWRFSKPYMRDWRVGEVKGPTVSLSKVVAASSAFPPVLSPVEIDLRDFRFTPGSGADLQVSPYTTTACLTDGGVYDNLGLETVWKRYRTVLVSDAGGKMKSEEEPKSDWPRHAYRVLDLVDNQVRSLRKRQLIDSYQADPADANFRRGAYWGIRTDISNYGLSNTLPCPFSRTMELAEIKTRLKAMDDVQQERLINWGYGVCDAALRAHVDPTITPAPAFPYPKSPI